MPRAKIVLALGGSILILGGILPWLIVVALLELPASSPTVFGEDADGRLPATGGETETGGRRLEGVDVRSMRTSGVEELSAVVDEILARLADLEERLDGLERDPLLRGFRYIESASPKLRRRGVRALKDIARHDLEALQAIRDMLGDEDAEVRIEAIETLADLENREAIPQLRGLLRDPESSVRLQILDILVELDAKEEGTLIAELLMDTDDEVRADAASALGRLKCSEGVDLLIGTLRDVDADVRSAAIEALGEIGATGAVGALLELHASRSETQPFRLLEVLRELGEPRPYRREIDHLSHTALHDSDENARYRSTRTLAKRARKEAQEVFRRALGDASARVRREAMRVVSD